MTATQPPTIVDTLDRFFAAIEAGDIVTVDRMYADEVKVWHNTSKESLDKAASVEVLRRFTSRVDDIHYEILSRHVGEGFVTQRHVLHGRVPKGELRVDVCIVIEVDGDLVTGIFEYFDSAELAVLLQK